MKCTMQMGSGGMLYMPSFITIGSGIHMFIGGIHTDSKGDS
jgi:hypothetical protein